MSAVPDAVERLKDHLRTITDLRSAAAFLRWDQETFMPPAAALARAGTLATLSRLAHEAFISAETGRLLEEAERVAGELDPDSDEAALVRMTRRDYDRQRKLPAEFVAERAREASLSVQVWREARRRDDFAAFRPSLEKMVDFARRTADYLGFTEHSYDALLDLYEPERTAREVEAIFARLREVTVPFVRAIAERGPVVDDGFLRQDYPEDGQRAFGLMVAEAFGYDLARGRLDVSAHPFANAFNVNDVRITTRYQRRYLPSAIFGIFHEAGHALYEQGVAPSLDRTPLARGASLGLHESQSRMWENLVGRSRPFWEHYFPKLQELFPEQLRGVDVERFYRAVNIVRPSLIRVEADEVTYNLHIMLRFELEKALLEGSLQVEALPRAWAEKMAAYLGLTPPSDADGVLQDIHWAQGSIGYFPTYSLGNIISVQLFEAARRAHPTLLEEFRTGRFATLLGWLRQNLHRHGRKFLPREILRRATGRELTVEPYLEYLRG
ncbi:MAG: carboxypeptidase M32, partial [Armatimonadota bacterium]|nr:carboxypeptidase M32 [Armatimonadota bacterium]